ncbi:MAG: mucoidy inhibitor MuiA family protein [Candidatus Competibacterales bacterium]
MAEFTPSPPGDAELAFPGASVTVPVVAVQVMEDRALVTRRGVLALEAGDSVWTITPVTPLLVDVSLSCRIVPPEDPALDTPPQVLNTQVQRRYLAAKARPEAEQKAHRELMELVSVYRGTRDGVEVAHRERRLLRLALEHLQVQLQDRLAVGHFDAHFPGAMAALFERRAQVEQHILQDERLQGERVRRFEQLLAVYQEAIRQVYHYQGAVTTTFWAPVAGHYPVEWSYQVPCALWRPYYTAELQGAPTDATVRWQSHAMVWQATGERWTDVALTLSTARPALGNQLPLLSDDPVKVRDKTDEERKTIQVSSREQTIATAAAIPQGEAADTPPGLDDGGEVRTYGAPHPVTIAADGQPHKIALEAWESAAKGELLCFPEQAPYAFRRSLQTNPSQRPLLAGPVQLTRHGGFVGTSQIALVAAGERFELSWGSEDGLVVLRSPHRQVATTPLKRHQRYTYDIQLYLANHTGVPCALEVRERIPVAEIKGIEVELETQQTTPNHRLDDYGLVSWILELAPGQEQKLRLVYRVTVAQNIRWDGAP